MAVYAIGDIQGCFAPLQELLTRLRFDPAQDRLWLAGDLVNRGPQSLETLRWARQMDPAVVCVLGNHDLHLLALAAGVPRRSRYDDLQAVLRAPDADELLDWLRQRPLAHYDPLLDTLLVHAGVPPGWDIPTVRSEARRVEQELRASSWRTFLPELYGNTPDRWDPQQTGPARLRYTINALTRMRVCRADGSLDLEFNGPPPAAPKGTVAWFDHPAAAWGATRVVAGHWSAAGFLQRDNLLMLDTGCVWGGQLTAMQLDDPYAIPVDVSCPARSS